MSAITKIKDFEFFDAQDAPVKAAILRRLTAVLEAKQAARGDIKDTLVRIGVKNGVAWQTVHRWIKDYDEFGEAGLADERKGKRGFHVPHLAVSWVRGLYHQHQRANDVSREVYRTVRTRYEKWLATGDPQWAIPGYDYPPPRSCSVSGDPEGLSYKTICRMMPDNFERQLTTRGQKEASTSLPYVLTTRRGSRVLSRICYDDQEYDTIVQGGLMLTGLPSASRPVGFNSLDFYTGLHLDHILRYRYTEQNEDTKKKTKKTLTGKDFTWFSIAGLQKHGYRTDELGTTQIFEHGTANAWANKDMSTIAGLHSYADAIFAVTDKHVSVSQSGKFNTPAFEGMYFKPQSTGNFRFKTWIESAFRLVRTYMQALPGPTGLSYHVAPEELYGIQKREEQLLKALTQLSHYHADLIRRHLMTFTEFGNLVMHIYQAINQTTDHDLEAWAECGFTYPVWRADVTSATWHTDADLQLLDEFDRKIMLAKIAKDSRLTTELNYSRAQAYEQEIKRDKAHIRKLQDQHVGYLVPTDWAHTLAIKANHTIIVPSINGAPPQSFVAQTKDHLTRTTFMAGQELLCFHNPFIPEKLIIHDLNGNYRATLYQNTAAEAWNYDRTIEQLEVRSQVKHDLSLQTRDEMRDVTATRTANEQHNDRLLKGLPVTDEEIALDRIAKADARTASRYQKSLEEEAAAAISRITLPEE